MFAHNIRGRWWCDSKGWTLPPIFCSTLLRDGWKQKSCLRKCHLTLKCVWSRGAELNSFMWEKMAPIDILWHLLNMYGDQKVDVSTVRAGWCISAVATVTWKSLKSCSRQPCAAITPQVKSISISSSAWISGSRPGDCVQSWILTSVHWKQWWQCQNITVYARMVPWMLTQELKEHHMRIC